MKKEKLLIAVLNYENGLLSVFPIECKDDEEAIEAEISKNFDLDAIEWMIIKSMEITFEARK